MGSSIQPHEKALAACDETAAEGLKHTVAAVRARAKVSMETAREALEQWRAQQQPPQVPIPEALQRQFAAVWARAVVDADARFTQERETAERELAAARAEAVEAGKLVDKPLRQCRNARGSRGRCR